MMSRALFGHVAPPVGSGAPYHGAGALIRAVHRTWRVQHTVGVRVRTILIAIAAGLALADASIVTLALPELLSELDTTVQGVAAVLGVYTVVLAVALIPRGAARPAHRARGPGRGRSGALRRGVGALRRVQRPRAAARRARRAGGRRRRRVDRRFRAAVARGRRRPDRAAAVARRRRARQRVRPRARRRADRGLLVAGDLLRAGADRAGGGAGVRGRGAHRQAAAAADRRPQERVPDPRRARPTSCGASRYRERRRAPTRWSAGAPARPPPPTEELVGPTRFTLGPSIALALVSAALTAVLFLLVLLLVAAGTSSRSRPRWP